MKVYVVTEECEKAENEGIHFQQIMGIYSTEEKAMNAARTLMFQNQADVAELDCDECRYWVGPYEVQ